MTNSRAVDYYTHPSQEVIDRVQEARRELREGKHVPLTKLGHDMPIQQDQAALAIALEDGVKGILNEMIDDSIADIQGPIRDISMRLAQSIRRPDRQDLVEACRDQLQMLVLEKRLKAAEGIEGFVGMFINVGVNALVTGAVGGLKSLKAV